MIYYDFKLAPNPTKARIVIFEHKLDIDIHEIDVANKENLSEDFLSINPRGTVPALKLDDGCIIADSLAIGMYLDSCGTSDSLFGYDPYQKSKVIEKTTQCEDFYLGIQEQFRNSLDRYKDRGLPGANPYKQIPELVDRGKLRVSNGLHLIEKSLNLSKYLAGDYYSFADITMYVYMMFGTKVLKLQYEDYPNLMSWLKRIESRDAVINAYA
jgi:glutathione S-transferase